MDSLHYALQLFKSQTQHRSKANKGAADLPRLCPSTECAQSVALTAPYSVCRVHQMKPACCFCCRFLAPRPPLPDLRHYCREMTCPADLASAVAWRRPSDGLAWGHQLQGSTGSDRCRVGLYVTCLGRPHMQLPAWLTKWHQHTLTACADGAGSITSTCTAHAS